MQSSRRNSRTLKAPTDAVTNGVGANRRGRGEQLGAIEVKTNQHKQTQHAHTHTAMRTTATRESRDGKNLEHTPRSAP